MRLGPQELVLILLIVLLLFGAARLPKLARSLREARDEFQKETDEPSPPPSDGSAPSTDPSPREEAGRPPDAT